jgi:hypothetical protein
LGANCKFQFFAKKTSDFLWSFFILGSKYYQFEVLNSIHTFTSPKINQSQLKDNCITEQKNYQQIREFKNQSTPFF